jgi:hypothetical protein
LQTRGINGNAVLTLLTPQSRGGTHASSPPNWKKKEGQYSHQYGLLPSNGTAILSARKFVTNPGAILSEGPPRRDSVGTRDSTHGKGTRTQANDHKMDRGKKCFPISQSRALKSNASRLAKTSKSMLSYHSSSSRGRYVPKQ